MAEEKTDEKKPPIITNKILALGFTAPFIFSIGGMAIAYFATQNSTGNIRNIALIIATFVGLFIAIGVIFLMQWHINRKIERTKD
jgi:hypothetical protein